jgi:hypothetical protein
MNRSFVNGGHAHAWRLRGHDLDVFGYVLGKAGAQRLMFAIDYPYEDS